MTGIGSEGSLGFLSVGNAGLSASFLADEALDRDVGGRLDDRDALDATELDRARRGVDRRGVDVEAGMAVGSERVWGGPEETEVRTRSWCGSGGVTQRTR